MVLCLKTLKFPASDRFSQNFKYSNFIYTVVQLFELQTLRKMVQYFSGVNVMRYDLIQVSVFNMISLQI